MPSLTTLYPPSGVSAGPATSTALDHLDTFRKSRPSPPRPAPLQQVPSYSTVLPTDITKAASTDTTAPFYPTPGDPQRPDYSPITPKVQPALPALVPPHPAQPHISQHERPREQQQGGLIKPATIAPPPPPTPSHMDQAPHPPAAAGQQEATLSSAQYIPRPHPQPFSSEDSTDAIALRAAISALQFQKKKAQDDIRALEAVRRKALQDPLLFRTELAAGRLHERRPVLGDLNSVLDASDSEGDQDDHKEEAVLGEDRPAQDQSQTEPVQSSSPKPSKPAKPAQSPFANVPGPQTVVRMPPINWDKYHILGAQLDELHEQQRRWPGSSTGSTRDRGREHAVAAPYSPFYDVLRDPDGGRRKDSGAAVVAATGTVSEHPMETRRSQGPPRTS